MITVDIKECLSCSKEKSLSDFYFRNDTKRYRSVCKSCFLQKRKIQKEELPDGFKRCPNCNIVRLIDNFYLCKHNMDGLCYTCKECMKKINSKRYQDKKEKILEQKRWRIRMKMRILRNVGV